jgi:thiamine biosynthesis lipoprotein
MRPLLGTYVEVAARGPAAAAAVERAFACLQDCHARWSFHSADSELSRLNQARGQRVALHRDTVRLLRLARALMVRSHGRFDITLGGLLVAEGVLPDHGGVPVLARGAAADIVVGSAWAQLQRPILLTLDGIAKGFSVDLACGALRRAGADAGWINAGGDLRVFGDLALPVVQRGTNQQMRQLGQLRNAAVATSRVAQDDDGFPSRLVGQAGQALEDGVWTVLARSAWRADALTKVAAATAAAERASTIAALGACLLT